MTIRLRITIVTLVAILLVVGVLAVTSNFSHQNEVDHFTKYALNSKQVLLNQILARHASEMSGFTKAITRDRVSQKAIKSGDIKALKEQINTTHNLFMSDGTLDRLQVLDLEGNYLASAPQQFTGKTVKQIVMQVAKEGKKLHGITRDDDGELQAVISFPLFIRGKMKAVVVYSRNIQRILDDFQVGDLSDVFILNLHGQIQHKGNDNKQKTISIPEYDIAQGGLEVVESDGLVYENILIPIHTLSEKVIGGLLTSRDQTEIYNAQNRINAISLGSVLFVVIGLAMGLSWYFRYLFRPIDQVVSCMTEIADGHLNCSVPECDTKDETSQLTQGLCSMVAKLHEVIGEITSSTDELNSASDQLSGVASRSTQQIVSQRQETDQVATAITEMAATVREVARNASEAAVATNDANTTAVNGKLIVQNTIGSIDELARNIQHAGEVIASLRAESDSIGSVLEVIRGIAEQTNLLALNAAIEAARAGEKGRGFAVVADEVRTLASRTQQSTEEIQHMIERLQGEANAAVKAVEESQESSSKTVEHANEAESALLSITESVTTITNMNTQIATAAEQQSTVAEMISSSINNIVRLSVEAEELTHDTSDSATKLTKLGETLRSMVYKFQL